MPKYVIRANMQYINVWEVTDTTMGCVCVFTFAHFV